MAHDPQIPPAAAQITICGTLNTESIAALVDVAMRAGAALIVQPRAIGTTPADVVDAAPPRPALPPARSASVRDARAAKPVRRPGGRGPAATLDLDVTIVDRVHRALAKGPLAPREFQRAARVSVHVARQLVARGTVIATGVTNGRRYALPGHPAKEAP